MAAIIKNSFAIHMDVTGVSIGLMLTAVLGSFNGYLQNGWF